VPNGKCSFDSLREIETLVAAFDAHTLPRKAWTHQAHLTVALWYLARYPRDEATRLIRSGIQRYNDACGVTATETAGYHETITLSYVAFIHCFLERARESNSHGPSLVALANRFFEQHGDRNLPL